jgi:toxin ParE1/3/4
MLRKSGRTSPRTREPADALIAEFQQKFDLLTDFPEIGPKRDYLAPGLRALTHGRYVIYYMATDSVLYIVRVLHGSRDARTLFEN